MQTYILDVSTNPVEQPNNEILKSIKEEGYDAVLAFNAVGQQNYIYDDRNLWDSMGIPFVNYIVDHPQMHEKGTHAQLYRGSSDASDRCGALCRLVFCASCL